MEMLTEVILMSLIISEGLCRNIVTFSDVHMVNSPGCTVSGDTLIECDGTEREVSAEERFALDVYSDISKKWSNDLNKILSKVDGSMEKLSFSFPDFPKFPPICKSCRE